MDAEAQLERFIAKYSDAVAAQIRAARARMRERLPGATELVYDNYNALAIGYGADDRVGGIVFSIAAYPRWINLFFARGAALEDPTGRLKGKGSQVRHIVLTDLALLDDPEVRALMDQALARAQPPIAGSGGRGAIIKSVSARQRPRRPA
ncbi:MAG: hypothetical protein JWQ46_1395 [Phenylobacterium sp.]|jgi:hypothetical protein|nr:hypothetical protein [Phenylobacterium sp.]MDB5466633.1 hypothetical protein [Phenylobacterium sp.]